MAVDHAVTIPGADGAGAAGMMSPGVVADKAA
jgi:hypothetical protein